MDRYLKPLTDHRAEELHVYANVPPTYLLGQKPVKELDQSFTNDEIMVLLQEILTGDQLAELESKQRLNYHYNSELGVFRCQARWSGGVIKTRFTYLADGATHSGAEHTGVAQAPNPSPAAPAAPTQVPPPVQAPMPVSPPVKAAPVQMPAAPPAQAGFDAEAFHSQAMLQAAAMVQQMSNSGMLKQAHAPSASVVNEPDVTETDMFEPFLRKIKPGKAPEIDRLFRILVDEGGSDLHLTSNERPMLRVDGKMRRIDQMPLLNHEQIAQLLAPIVPRRNREEFTKHNDTDFAYEIKDLGRFRSNIFTDNEGIGAVFRLIPSEVVTAEQLALPKSLRDLCYLSKGLVLVTGPTGSGKSTTLCALIDLINRTRDDHIITIEDPIEFVHPNKRCLVNQREVGVHTDSFKKALRAALREDPDIILVGELRDLETISIAIETAETGHLVFGTLHTTSAISTVDRIIDQFPGDRQSQIRVMLADALKAVVSQSLLRKKGGGRVAAMEILLVTQGVSHLIREQKIHQIQSIMQTSRALGMQRLNDVLFDYVSRNIVDIKEAYMKAIDKIHFIEQLEKAGINTTPITRGGNPADGIF